LQLGAVNPCEFAVSNDRQVGETLEGAVAAQYRERTAQAWINAYRYGHASDHAGRAARLILADMSYRTLSKTNSFMMIATRELTLSGSTT
jgi:hypothetical protein